MATAVEAVVVALAKPPGAMAWPGGASAGIGEAGLAAQVGGKVIFYKKNCPQ